MNQRLEIFDRVLITHHQAAEVLQPGVRALNDPPPLVPTQLASVLLRCHSIVPPPEDDGLNGMLDQQGPHGIAVVAAIGNQALGFGRATARAAAAFQADGLEGRGQQGNCRGGCLLQAYSTRGLIKMGEG